MRASGSGRRSQWLLYSLCCERAPSAGCRRSTVMADRARSLPAIACHSWYRLATSSGHRRRWPRYAVSLIGTLAGCSTALARGVNNHGSTGVVPDNSLTGGFAIISAISAVNFLIGIFIHQAAAPPEKRRRHPDLPRFRAMMSLPLASSARCSLRQLRIWAPCFSSSHWPASDLQPVLSMRTWTDPLVGDITETAACSALLVCLPSAQRRRMIERPDPAPSV